MLEKAQQLNTSAREVFEFTARCCGSTSHGHHGSGNGGWVNDAGDSGGNSRPSSPVNGDTVGTRTGDTITINAAVTFSLSPGELSEGEALLFKIRRCTSAPRTPDDQASTPKARTTIHPGVRHRVEV